MRIHILLALIFLPFCAQAAPARPVVLELFTSQGCSACPAADALLEKLSASPEVITLSYHIAYWDYLGWKDPFALPAATARQRAYTQILRDSVYTPQMVIDGHSTATGSDERAIRAAIHTATTSLPHIPVRVQPQGQALNISVAAAELTPSLPLIATVWGVEFRDLDETEVKAGENTGRRLRHKHNVVAVRDLGKWQGEALNISIPLSELKGNGLAVLVQGESFGRMAGAAAYIPGASPAR